jgi:hypothetical protein
VGPQELRRALRVALGHRRRSGASAPQRPPAS